MSRRRFLRNSMGAAIALPFLPSLAGRARAAAGHKRMVVFHVPHNETDQFLPPNINGPLDLSDSSERTGTYLHPLDEFRDRTLVMSGMVGAHGHHKATSEFLSGRPQSSDDYRPTQGPTLDQFIAGRLEGATRLPSLQLAMANERRIAEDHVVLSWSESRRAVPGYWRTSDAFRAVYGGAAPTMTDGSAEREAAFQTSLLSGVQDQYRTLQRRLSAEDRRLMDQHLDYLTGLEVSVAQPAGAMCSVPSAVPEDWPKYSREVEDKRRQIREHLEIAAGALRCDATRVITINLGGEFSGIYTWAGVTDAHHQIAHQNPAIPNHRQQHFLWRQHVAELVAGFCRMLDETPDGDGTLLDSTAVVWLPELGLWGRDGGNSHLRSNVPGCIIGGCGGYFRGGQAVDLAGTSYHNLLLTLGHAMGYEDLVSFGDEGTQVLDALRA